MNENEIILGDYVISLSRGFNTNAYDIYHHTEQVGFIWVLDDMSLYSISADDTDLITLLLLKYQTSPKFRIYPYNK